MPVLREPVRAPEPPSNGFAAQRISPDAMTFRLGLFPRVDREGFADVTEFLGLPSGAAPDKSLVRTCVDQITLHGAAAGPS